MKNTCGITFNGRRRVGLRPDVRVLLLLVICAFTLVGGGCSGVLFTAAYLWKGHDQDPKYDFLKKGEKTVVVVCRSSAVSQFEGTETVPRDLNRQVAKLLKQNVKNKKLHVVDYRKVNNWLDDTSHTFENFEEVGSALKADIVIGVDLELFRLSDSPGTMQGRARWTVKTYDMNEDELIAEEHMDLLYPPSMPIQMQDNSSLSRFQLRMVDIISRQIAALYHPHDPRKIYEVIDADALELH